MSPAIETMLPLLVRYYASDCTREQRAEVERWIAADPAHQEWFDRLHEAWQSVRRFEPGEGEGDILARMVSARIAQAKEYPLGPGRPRSRFAMRPMRSPLVGFLLGTLAVVAVWRLRDRSMDGQVGMATVAYKTYATVPGQRATITLPDGNTVVLSVASRLDVPTNYSNGHHTVRLTVGEALFTVSGHGEIPFTVVSGSTVTRVLGTRFVVRHYATDSSVIVAVKEGKVAVGTSVVAARRLVEVDARGRAHERAVDPDRFTFATGVLALDSMRLSDAIPELERWYDAKIRLGDPALAQQAVEGKFAEGSLTNLSELLDLTFNVRVVREGRTLTLYPRGR